MKELVNTAPILDFMDHVEALLKFMKDYIIECDYHTGCGRYDEARELVSKIEMDLEQLDKGE